jgi:hypothetical protein
VPLPTQNLCIAVGFIIPPLGRLSASTVDEASSSATYSLACYSWDEKEGRKKKILSIIDAMAPPKAADGRRKSATKHGLLVTLSLSPELLRDIYPSVSVKEASQSPESKLSKEDSQIKESPASPSALAVSTVSNGDNASDSNAASPAAETTPAPTPMGPPADGAKKKGVKRSAAAANGTIDGVPKPRGKPGPKKKPRL